jgi:hypothetical protein
MARRKAGNPMSMTDMRPALPKPDRPARHGLIEDWRDALWVLLLLLVAAFSGALITRFWPAGNDDDTAGNLPARVATLEASIAKDGRREVATLKDRVAKLEARQKSIEAALAAGAVGGNLAAIGTTLAPGAAVGPGIPAVAPAPDLRKELADLTARLAAAEAKTNTFAALDTRLAKLEGSDLLELARRAAHANAVANLMRAAQGSSPFKTEYDVVAAMMPGDKRVAEIAPLAQKGVPTIGTMIGTFPSIADAARDAEDAAKGETWWERLWASFTGMVSVRSVGETQGASTDARLARGEVRLKAGDLAAAVKELAPIGGVARDTLAPWLAEAKARVTLEAAIADLNARAIAALTSDTSTDPVPQLPPP